MTQPYLITNGEVVPISHEDYQRARRCQPLAIGRPRRTSADDSTEVARKARAFDAMMAGQAPSTASASTPAAADEPAEVVGLVQASNAMTSEQSRTMSRNSMLRLQGVDPKSLATPGAAPKTAVPALDGRAMSRANMEKRLRMQGIEPVKR